MSWLILKNALITFGSNHPQINSIGFGDPLSIGTDNTYNFRTINRDRIVFPLLFVDLQSASIGQGTNTLALSVLIMDRVDDAAHLRNPNLIPTAALINRWRDNEDEILNDTLLIYTDLIAKFTDDPEVDYSLGTSITLTRFIEGRDDKVAGWQGTLNFTFPYGRNVCQIPI